MAIIEDRIRQLNLPESDCAPLSKQEFEALLLTVKPLAAGEASDLGSQAFSIADLETEAATTKLKSLEVEEEMVLVCWPAFREGFQMKWSVFLARFGELLYPGSDDVIVTSPSVSWALGITHEEMVRFFSLKNGRG